ncbi:MAG: Na+/H+ antiporter subunit B [Rhodospirillales bacterium]|nr:MAG: Na+/H+ antiporter subunit B [Rhodospirillales bacterium]
MHSLILSTATRFLTGLMLVFSVFLLLRGHNEPGGGFVGSLVASTAFALYAIALGAQAVRRALRVDPRTLVMVGLALAIIGGLLPLIEGAPLFTGVWTDIPLPRGGYLHVGSPLIFDVGVYLVVVGAVLTVILTMEEEVL